MAGKSDDGGKDGAPALTAILNSEIERIADLLPQVPLSHEDVAGLDRHARAIASVARAAKLVGSLTTAAARDGVIPDGEGEDDTGDTDDPATMEALRAELRSRMEHHRAAVGRLRAARGLEPEGAEAGDCEPATAPRSPGRTAGGLANLGVAGRARVGKDLCRRVVAEPDGAV